MAVVGTARMPLFDHIGELRRRLVIIVIALLIAACVMYTITPGLIQFLIDPIRQYMPDDGSLNVLTPLGGFTIRFKVAMFASVIVTTPVWLWQLMGFFLPALKPNERRWVVPTFLTGVLLFVAGNVFCYCVILSPSFGWMFDQTNDFATIFADATEFINLILLFEIGFGIAFELPIIVFYLIIFNVVPYKKLRNSWRVVYIVLLVISAVVTPDASPVTMFLMFAAMLVLYEGSLLVARIALGPKIHEQNAAYAAKLAEEKAEQEAYQAERAAKRAAKND
jgi:sec-independent protein translocase protein TatC